MVPLPSLATPMIRSGRFGLSRYGLADSVWPIRSGQFGLAVSVTGHFGRDIAVHKELMKLVNLAQVTSVQFGQTVLLFKSKIS